MLHGAGRASAATLGYIVGNVPGAIAGDKAFRMLHKSKQGGKNSSLTMPLSKRRKIVSPRGRAIRTGTSSGYTRKRKANQSTRPRNIPGSYKITTKRKRFSKEKQSNLAGYGAQTIQGSKKLVEKKKRVPKVTKVFKEKVHRALDPNNVHGTYVALNCEGYLKLGARPLTDNNKQFVWSGLGVLASALPGDDYPWPDCGGWSFLADQYLRVASILWNGATATNSASTWNLNSASNLSPNTTKFWIRDSYTQYELKNMSQRVVTLRVFELAAKSPMGYNTQKADNRYWIMPSGTGVLGLSALGDNLAGNHPAAAWANALGDDFQNFSAYQSIPAAQSALNVNVLDLYPTQSKSLKSVYKCAMLKEYVMEPGEQVKFKVQGPNQVEYDYQKFWKNNAFMSIQKSSRGIFFTVKEDLVCASNRLAYPAQNATTPIPAVTPNFIGTGRLIDTISTAVIALERKDFYMLEMPETVVPTGGTAQTQASGVTGRRDAYVHDVYNNINLAGQLQTVEVDRDMPQSYALV